MSTNGRCVRVVNREWESREKGYHNTGFPICAFTMGANDTGYKCITDSIFNYSIINSRPVTRDFTSAKGEQEYPNTHEVIKNWFSMYTKWSDIWIATGARLVSTQRFMDQSNIPFKYAFWIELSTLVEVPMDHGPHDRQICISQVPVSPCSSSSWGLKSGGGNRNGIVRLWFLIRSR